MTIYPIQTELLSGRVSREKEKEIREALDAIDHIDLDWNARSTWEQLVEFAQIAHKASLPIPGIVDRMILAAAAKAEVMLWTLERPLTRLAERIKVPLFS